MLLIALVMILGFVLSPVLWGIEFGNDRFIEGTGTVRSVEIRGNRRQPGNLYVMIELPDRTIWGSTIQNVQAGQRVSVVYKVSKHGVVQLTKVIPEQPSLPSSQSIRNGFHSRR